MSVEPPDFSDPRQPRQTEWKTMTSLRKTVTTNDLDVDDLATNVLDDDVVPDRPDDDVVVVVDLVDVPPTLFLREPGVPEREQIYSRPCGICQCGVRFSTYAGSPCWINRPFRDSRNGSPL
jgi:hypothetical protein